MSVSKQQVISLLGQGLSNETVASAVGCHVSYIVQLMAEPALREQVTVARTKALTSHNNRDAEIDQIEDKIISKLGDTIEFIHKPSDLLRAFAVVNAAKRRGVAAHEGISQNKTVVNLQLPAAIRKVALVINQQGEVIQADNETLVSMPAGQLMQHLKNIGGGGADYEKVARYLPGSVAAPSGTEAVLIEGECSEREADVRAASKGRK